MAALQGSIFALSGHLISSNSLKGLQKKCIKQLSITLAEQQGAYS